MKILFMQTGGTIDKDYPMGQTNHGYSFLISTPASKRVLDNVNPSFEYEMQTVLQKDSIDITDEERLQILKACQDSSLEKIIITHGTDTMIQTAELLDKIKDKTIVLTGSLAPELFKNTDADFNIGMAVSAVSILENGVYIAMNGLILPWRDIAFDNKLERFINKNN
ncbi:MAG: asparaginase domain-containing protein [Candidatus Saccharimonadales bacterium]